MQPQSQRSTCHEQNQRYKTGSVKSGNRINAIRSVARFLRSALGAAMKQQPNYSDSLKYLSEHQLRDIGFTRDPPNRNIPETTFGVLQSGLHEQSRTRIRRLPRS